ncbi:MULTISPECIES: PTS sugar transporter subunit IIA [Lacticaseibacillus]|uniref:PTS sugar transporter subunit IIA n=1 Tax=Lacticaseibacillus TaxID=2759736 RepID=UPI00063DBF5F|nr:MULTISPECIES: PTS sugar transporter subunit IIA [Lacticaseibacillus]KLI75701.1 PTS galactitol transporter subunit IIA [Lacticaseibacillus casei]
MDYSTMIHKDLIFLNEDAADRKRLFRDVAKKIQAAGYVKDTYEAALNRREDAFPTGIVFPEISVMLPHADPVNVNRPFMAIVKNAQPVRVLQMGYNKPEDATAMFFLGITDSSQQVGLLQIFMDLLQNGKFVAKFKAINDPEAMYEFFVNTFKAQVAGK